MHVIAALRTPTVNGLANVDEMRGEARQDCCNQHH